MSSVAIKRILIYVDLTENNAKMLSFWCEFSGSMCVRVHLVWSIAIL